MEHILKIWPEYFILIASGEKNFELRKNDRNYKAGDTLILKEYCTQFGYSGKGIRVEVTNVVKNVPAFGLMDGYCIMSTKIVK